MPPDGPRRSGPRPARRAWRGRAVAGAPQPRLRPYTASIRRSQVAGTFGPGAIVDFRGPDGAPLSGVVAGLEEWDAAGPQGQQGLLHFQITSEPRLQRRLSVSGFRLPPVSEDETALTDVLPVVRFPAWLVCPRCERLDRAGRFSFDPGRSERVCASCSVPGTRVHAVPARFIVACEDGHLDEFPWQAWIGCRCPEPRLRLRTAGAGLAGKVVRCDATECQGAPTSLEGAFSRNALQVRGLRCRGRRPWLRTPASEPCQRVSRVLQRGASSTYYSVVESALDIPPFSADLSRIVGHHWANLQALDPADWPEFIRMNQLERLTGRPAEVLLRLFAEWRRALGGDSPDAPLEWAEYLQLLAASREPVDAGEFQARPERVPPELGPYMGPVVLVRRLREVRALVGFTRVSPPSGPFRDPASRLGRLYVRALNWLPAIELRGEGVFIGFHEDSIRAWEGRPAVRERAAILATRRMHPDGDRAEETRRTSPRFLLLHTFAHALMRQLSLSCGYSSAALRERLYVGATPREMAGILIHTGSPDSEGTLGGLVRQGQEDLLEVTIREMLASLSWCSSDPLCITGAVTLSSPENLAACHACVLVPETSCQHFNLLLDRAMIVGTPEDLSIGYLASLLAESVG